MNQADALVAQAYQFAYTNSNAVDLAATQAAAPELPPVIRSLMAVGLLGWVYKQRDDATAACDAVEPMLHSPLQFHIHRALAQAMGGDAQHAAETINKHLEKQPDDDAAKVLLGVSLMLAEDSGWREVFQNVLASSTDQDARQAAMQVVGYLRSLA